MTDSQSKQPTTGPKVSRAISLGAILLGFLCIVGGIWLINSTPERTSVAAATAQPMATPTATATPLPTETATETTETARTVAPTATATTPPNTTESTPTARGESFRLVILHSNDTWGYLMPCG